MNNEEKKTMEQKLSFKEYYSGANEAQREAIESDSALTVVAASAGTGKTYTLAQKVAYILSDEDKNVASSEILVLTFTVKAAQEMQERIKATLKKWYETKLAELTASEGATVAISRLAYLKEKLDTLDDAYISNLHSFSKRIISEGGLALDLDPNAKIIAEPQLSRWLANLEEELSQGNIARFISLLPEVASPDSISRVEAEEFFTSKEENLTELLQFYGTGNLAEAVRLVGNELPSHGFTVRDLWNWQEESERHGSRMANPHSVCREIRRRKLSQVQIEWKIAAELYQSNFGELEITEEKYLDQICLFDFAKYVLALENLQDEASQDEFVKQIDFMIAEFQGCRIMKESPAANLQQYLPEGKFSDWKKNYTKNIKPFSDLSCLETELSRKTLLERVIAVLWHSFICYKKQNNLIELSELVQNAKKLFEKDEKYAKKFKYIFVDEFQDTDPLQDSLINALWHKPNDKSDILNRLFIVGDFKQSIYSFRGAEPSLLLKYKLSALTQQGRGAKELARFIALRENYRTDRHLIDSINEFFSKIWSLPVSPTFVYGEPDRLIYPDGKAENTDIGINCPCTFWRYETPADASIGLKRIARAESVAEDIATKSRQMGQEWSNFCVLVRGRNEFPYLENAFTKRNIPFVLCEAKNFFGKIETEDIINYLTLLSDLNNMTALASWLMSPISTVTQEKAIAILEEAERRIRKYKVAGKLPEKNSLVLCEVFQETLPDLASELINNSQSAKILGAGSAIENLLENQEKLLTLVNENSRKRLILNLIHIKEITREFEECFNPSLAETVEYLAESLNKNVESLEPDMAELGSNSVTVMTIHASKGLEFDNVYLLLDTDKKSPPDTKKFTVTAKLGCLASCYPFDGNEKPTLLKAVYKELRAEEEEAEGKRLIYVGFTRAKKSLTVALIGRKTDDNEMFDISTCTSIEEKIIESDKITCTVCESAEKDTASGQELDLVTNMPKRLSRLTASVYALWSWCPVAYRSSFRQGKSLVWQGENGEGSDFGTACHKALQRWDFDISSLASLTAKQKQSKQIFALLSQFAKSEICREAASVVASGQAMREAPFDVELVYGTEKLHLVGVIDLIWQDEEGLHIRDWKTTEEEAAPSGFYQKQLDFYALALSEYMKQNGKNLPIDTAIIYLGSDKKSDFTRYGDKKLDAIKEDVINCSIACVGCEFSPRTELCKSCPMAQDCRKQ